MPCFLNHLCASAHASSCNWTGLSVGDWKTTIQPGAVVETQLFPFIFNEPAGCPAAGVVTITGNGHCPGFLFHFVSIWTPC